MGAKTNSSVRDSFFVALQRPKTAPYSMTGLAHKAMCRWEPVARRLNADRVHDLFPARTSYMPIHPTQRTRKVRERAAEYFSYHFHRFNEKEDFSKLDALHSRLDRAYNQLDGDYRLKISEAVQAVDQQDLLAVARGEVLDNSSTEHSADNVLAFRRYLVQLTASIIVKELHAGRDVLNNEDQWVSLIDWASKKLRKSDKEADITFGIQVIEAVKKQLDQQPYSQAHAYARKQTPRYSEIQAVVNKINDATAQLELDQELGQPLTFIQRQLSDHKDELNRVKEHTGYTARYNEFFVSYQRMSQSARTLKSDRSAFRALGQAVLDYRAVKEPARKDPFITADSSPPLLDRVYGYARDRIAGLFHRSPSRDDAPGSPPTSPPLEASSADTDDSDDSVVLGTPAPTPAREVSSFNDDGELAVPMTGFTPDRTSVSPYRSGTPPITAASYAPPHLTERSISDVAAMPYGDIDLPDESLPPTPPFSASARSDHAASATGAPRSSLLQRTMGAVRAFFSSGSPPVIEPAQVSHRQFRRTFTVAERASVPVAPPSSSDEPAQYELSYVSVATIKRLTAGAFAPDLDDESATPSIEEVANNLVAPFIPCKPQVTNAAKPLPADDSEGPRHVVDDSAAFDGIPTPEHSEEGDKGDNGLMKFIEGYANQDRPFHTLPFNKMHAIAMARWRAAEKAARARDTVTVDSA